MHDTHHHHESERCGEITTEIAKLRKMAEHWIGHNEEHARSYRLWANRARERGHEAAAGILEGIADQALEQNREFSRIIEMIDSAEG